MSYYFYHHWLNYYPGLYEAAANGDTSKLANYINDGANLNTYSWWSHETPLYAAAANGHSQAVSLLVEHGADINARTYRGSRTPLDVAAAKNHTDTVSILLNQKATLEAEAYTHQLSPLHHACKNMNFKMAQALLEHGAEINSKTNVFQNHASYKSLNPLMYALLDKNTFKFDTDSAAQVTLVKMLMEKGATIDITYDQVFSHIDTLVLPNLGTGTSSSVSIIQTPKFNPELSLGRNKLHEAASKLSSDDHNGTIAKDITDLELKIIENPKWINMQDDFGLSPLHYLLQDGSFDNTDEAIALFVKSGANLELEDILGHTPLFYAAKFGNLEAVDSLIKHGADSTHLDHHGRDYAEFNNHLEIKSNDINPTEKLELSDILSEAAHADILYDNHTTDTIDSIVVQPLINNSAFDEVPMQYENYM